MDDQPASIHAAVTALHAHATDLVAKMRPLMDDYSRTERIYTARMMPLHLHVYSEAFAEVARAAARLDTLAAWTHPDQRHALYRESDDADIMFRDVKQERADGA